MSQRITVFVVAFFAFGNVGMEWIVDDTRRFIVNCVFNFVIMIPSGMLVWRGIVVYTAKQLAKAEPAIAAALAARPLPLAISSDARQIARNQFKNRWVSPRRITHAAQHIVKQKWVVVRQGDDPLQLRRPPACSFLILFRQR